MPFIFAEHVPDWGALLLQRRDDLFGFWDGTLRGDLCIGNSEGLRYGEFTGQADCL